jgi:hypothetical protein
VMGFFEIGSLLGWLWTAIFLISASWTARIIGVSPVPGLIYVLTLVFLPSLSSVLDLCCFMYCCTPL